MSREEGMKNFIEISEDKHMLLFIFLAPKYSGLSKEKIESLPRYQEFKKTIQEMEKGES